MVLGIIALPILSIVALMVYRMYFHPLRHIPGPWFATVSSLFLYLICYIGIEGRVTRHYHNKFHTRVLRIGPNALSISDGNAIRSIYVSSGGFPKDVRYKNFNLGPFETIFSTLNTAYRDVRAKAVSPLFSPAAIKEESQPEGSIGRHVQDFVTQLKDNCHAKVKTDLLDLSAKLSIDVVSEYLLGLPYGGLTEHVHLSLEDRQTDEAKLSANAFVHAIVGFARFSLLPNWLFKKFYSISQRLARDEKADRSFAKIADFIDQVMAQTKEASNMNASQKRRLLYQDRLLATGVSFTETAAQSKAILFAGADSTAIALATTLFHLTRNNNARHRLLHEIRSVSMLDSKTQTELSFLKACVKEGLRLCMANPTRLTRIVPNTATLEVDGLQIPAGSVVGCAASVLHYDSTVFPYPFEFKPERWMKDNSSDGLRRPDMDKNLMVFGHGLRACLGRNLALHQLHLAVAAVVDAEILEYAKCPQDEIKIIEWFNGDIVGHKIEIGW